MDCVMLMVFVFVRRVLDLEKAAHDGVRPRFSDQSPPEIEELVRSCWHANPRRRATMTEVRLSVSGFSFSLSPLSLFLSLFL